VEHLREIGLHAGPLACGQDDHRERGAGRHGSSHRPAAGRAAPRSAGPLTVLR
jgi:hypothetical protein